MALAKVLATSTMLANTPWPSASSDFTPVFRAAGLWVRVGWGERVVCVFVGGEEKAVVSDVAGVHGQ